MLSCRQPLHVFTGVNLYFLRQKTRANEHKNTPVGAKASIKAKQNSQFPQLFCF